MSETQKHTKPNVPNLRFPGFSGEWENCTLGQLGDIKGGGTPDTLTSKYWNGGIQWFTPSEIGKTKYVYKSERTISNEGLINSSAKLLPPKSILLSSRATVGECSINLEECCTNQGFQSFVPNTLVEGEFLYYRLLTHKKELIRKACGSTFLEISAKQIGSISSSIPEKQEQEKILSFLSLIDERIAIQNKVIEDFKMLKATLSRKLLWDNPLLSKRVQLSNFGTLKNGYAFKSSEYIPESEFRIVTIANVTGEREISIKNCNTIHSLPRDIQEHQKLKPNDILVSLTGNVGRVSLCNLDGCLLNQRVGLFVLNDDYLHEYIFQVLSDIRFLQSMINSGQGAAQMNIGKYDVESFFIPFSEDLNLLNKIADMLYSIDLRITQSMKDLLLLRKQKHYFLSNLFI